MDNVIKTSMADAINEGVKKAQWRLTGGDTGAVEKRDNTCKKWGGSTSKFV